MKISFKLIFIRRYFICYVFITMNYFNIKIFSNEIFNFIPYFVIFFQYYLCLRLMFSSLFFFRKISIVILLILSFIFFFLLGKISMTILSLFFPMFLFYSIISSIPYLLMMFFHTFLLDIFSVVTLIITSSIEKTMFILYCVFHSLLS